MDKTNSSHICVWNSRYDSKCVINKPNFDCKKVIADFEQLKQDVNDDKTIEAKIKKYISSMNHLFSKNSGKRIPIVLKKRKRNQKKGGGDYDKMQNVYHALFNKGILKWLVNKFGNICWHNRMGSQSVLIFQIDKTDNQYLYFATSVLEDLFTNCLLNKESRFVIMDITLDDLREDGMHANILIADTQKMEVERYEPYGNKSRSQFNLLDDALESFFSDLGYSYIPPQNICPTNIGHQTLAEMKTKEVAWNGEGFCQTWVIFWTYLRIANPDMDRGLLYKKSQMVFDDVNLPIHKYIECFSKYLFIEIWKMYKKGKIHVAYI